MRLEGDPRAGRFIEHVAFRGLTFSHTEYALPPGNAGDKQAADGVPGAIWAAGARDVIIAGCTVTSAGTYGIEAFDTRRGVCWYLNAGDTYTVTLLHFQGRYRIGCWGDIAERHTS